MPLIMLPMVLSDMANAIVSAGRIRTFLLSEELSTAYTIEPGRKFGLHVDGDFQWESLKGLVLDEKPLDIEAEAKKIEEEQKLEEEKAKKKKQEEKARKKAEKRAKGGRMVEETEKPIQDEPNQTSEEPPVEEQPFGLQGLKFDVPKGSFVAIVGKVGSGKVSRDNFCVSNQLNLSLELYTTSANRRDEKNQRRNYIRWFSCLRPSNTLDKKRDSAG